jgi:EAL domain-containing protein (putative c-di-GMP-specific phosphodiesterase class I)/GGDEF domain-containing protein
MIPSVISQADRELLEAFHLALTERDLNVGEEFLQEMQACGLGEDRELATFFSGMMLNGDDLLIKMRFGSSGAPESSRIVALFDAYLLCLARRAASLLTDPVITRRTLEAVRRLAFHYMAEAISASESAPKMPHASEWFDPHTGLLNQEGFLAALDYLLEDDANRNLAAILLELDYGVTTPDFATPVQQEIARRLLHVAREGDLAARISSQRWALGLSQVKSADQAMLAAQKLKRQFDQPLVIADRTRSVTSRIGIAMTPEHGNRAELLQRLALKAARWAAHADQNIQVYSPAIDLEHTHSRELGALLRQALFENSLQLHYQPLFSLSQNRVVGVEALLRWESPQGFVPPSLMLELIDNEGLAPHLTQWLLHNALRHYSLFLRQGMDIDLSVNLLPQNFNQDDFPEIVAQILDVWRTPANRITFEIMESSIFDDIETTARQIGKLKALGLMLAMDNFGIGYSSMSYLSRLDIDQLKIDQSFVRSMPASSRDEAIVKAIANLAENFGLTLVAEGVESKEIADRVQQFGCDIIQGYWISKPLSPEQLIVWWRENLLPKNG